MHTIVITVHGKTEAELMNNISKASKYAVEQVKRMGSRANETGEGYEFDTCQTVDDHSHAYHVAAVQKMDEIIEKEKSPR